MVSAGRPGSYHPAYPYGAPPPYVPGAPLSYPRLSHLDHTVPSARKVAERRLHLFFLIGAVVGIVLGIGFIPLAEHLPSPGAGASASPALRSPRVVEVEGARSLFVFPPPVAEERAGSSAQSSSRSRGAAVTAAGPIVTRASGSSEPARLAVASKRPRSRAKTSKADAPAASGSDLLSAGL